MNPNLHKVAMLGYLRLWPLVNFFHRLVVKPEAGACRILMLHDVPESQADNFHQLLQYLLKDHGVLTPRETEARLTGAKVPLDHGRVPYLLTFDDGLKSNSTVARDILESYGVKAIFFVCPDLLDLPEERHEQVIIDNINTGNIDQFLPEERRFMSWEDCRLLLQSGHVIGAHTRSHRRLAGLNETAQIREIVTSGEILKQRLGVPIEWFAYPFGFIDCIDASSMQIIRSHYRFCCSGLRGLNLPDTRLLTLLREHLSLDMPFEHQQLILSGALDLFYLNRVKRLDRLIHG